MSRREFVAAVGASTALAAGGARGAEEGKGAFQAGACAVDISPQSLPVIVSGMFFERTANRVHQPLHARALVLDDGSTRLALCVVDSLMMPRELVDEAKRQAAEATGIPVGHMLVAATHTHSAPSVMGALGSGVDEAYARTLPGRIAEAIRGADANLAPARVGWAVVQAPDLTHCRRWIFRPDRMRSDPFGQRTVRAHMHPGYQNPACTGPAGPADPDLTVLSVQSPQGRPIAVLANLSMHYYGSSPVSSDYFGLFPRKLARRMGAEGLQPPFVAILAQGTSGDLHWMDYSRPKNPPGMDRYADAVAEAAHRAVGKVEYRGRAALAAKETRLALRRRVAEPERLAWARRVVDAMEGRKPTNHRELYALEQVLIAQEPQRELILQAFRVGELGIVGIPCEVYGITGLKIKARSPLQPTLNIELANGAEGYIPPPEQHALGGYTTWPARTAGLETQAEPKIVEAVLGLLEDAAGRPRREPAPTHGPYARAVLASKPVAYWRMDEMSGPHAADDSGNGHRGTYEPGVAFFLPGPAGAGFSEEGRGNRAAHFAGGRMRASVEGLGERYSVELWLWNAMPTDARPVAGYAFSRGPEGAEDAPGDHLGIGGTHLAAGKLLLFNGDARNDALVGPAVDRLRTWYHVALVRDGADARLYVNGELAAQGRLPMGCAPDAGEVCVGGRSDNFANFEGKLDEVALYDRPLSPEEVAAHHAAAD